MVSGSFRAKLILLKRLVLDFTLCFNPVFLSTRHDEFLMRMKGISYEQIAINGGGIVSTVDSVNKSSKEKIINNLMLKMDEFIRFGTTTIEAKSGYGLSVESELKSLSCLNSVNKNHAIELRVFHHAHHRGHRGPRKV